MCWRICPEQWLKIHSQDQTKEFSMNTDVILSFVRQTLTFIGGLFVAKGTITADTLTDLVTNLSTVIGGIISLVSIYWSYHTHSEQA
jgi:hypothetical protein